MEISLTRNETMATALLKQLDLGRSIALIVAFSLLTAIAAQIAIPLPFSPVPITGQTFAVLLTGALLGSRLGALTMIAYLVEGASGMPFFSNGHGGLPFLLFSPTAGYLFAYPAAAFATGWLAERGWDKRFTTAMAAMLLGSLIILVSGWAWLAIGMGSASKAFFAGIAPFVPGDLIKAALGAAALPGGWAVLRFMGKPGK
jgi:biotin transport system substrate-specific component